MSDRPDTPTKVTLGAAGGIKGALLSVEEGTRSGECGVSVSEYDIGIVHLECEVETNIVSAWMIMIQNRSHLLWIKS
jgi:hypothetical protein